VKSAGLIHRPGGENKPKWGRLLFKGQNAASSEKGARQKKFKTFNTGAIEQGKERQTRRSTTIEKDRWLNPPVADPALESGEVKSVQILRWSCEAFCTTAWCWERELPIGELTSHEAADRARCDQFDISRPSKD